MTERALAVPPFAGRAPALEEWAVVVRALLTGEQILVLRSDGVREAGRHLALPATRVWLSPAVGHTEHGLVRPAYRRWVDDAERATPPDGAVRIEGWADVVGVARLTDPVELEAIGGKFVWTSGYAASRLHWHAPEPLWVLALRVHRLLEPIVVPRGAAPVTSAAWADVAGLPDDPATRPSEPALSDEAFAARLGFCANDLPDGLATPVADG